MTVKELVSPGNTVQFLKYFDGQLWYQVVSSLGLPMGFTFPVPISDIGPATFLATDKALIMMRYIRKHLQVIELAKAEQAETKS